MEIIGKHHSAIVPEGETTIHANLLPEVLARGRMEGLEVVRQRKDGALIDISITLSALHDAKGQIVGMSSVARDITDRKRAEVTLQAEREFMHALLESLQEGIVACDAAGEMTLFNHATRIFHGLPEVPLSPYQWARHFDLFDADGLTPMRKEDIPLFRAFQGEVVRGAEMVIAPKNGNTRTIVSSGQAIYGTDGSKLGAVVAMHDVTAQRGAEREAARLAAIVESSEDAVLAATLDGILISWNHGAERLYGYTAAEMIGQHASLLTPPDQESPVAAAIERLVSGTTVEPLEVARVRKDGVKFYAALTFSLIRNTAGQKVGLSCIARDITTRRLAEVELVKSKIALEESEARIRRLSDAAFEGVAVAQDGVLVDANSAFASLFGYEAPTEMRGLAGMALAAPESLILVTQKVSEHNEEPYEATLLRRDGSKFQAELRGRMIELDERPARITAVRDISERKRMEKAMLDSHHSLQENEARLAEAQRIASVGNWEYDIATQSITWSDQLFRLFGMDPKNGPPSVDALMARYHPDDVPMHARVTELAIRDGLPYEFDIRILQHDGSVCWAHAVGRGERSASGSIVRLFGTLMDIHERKLAEERFRVLFEQSSHAHLLVGEGKIIDCNSATLSLMGCSDKAQLLSLHPIDLSPTLQPDGRHSSEKGLAMQTQAFERGSHRFEWIHCKLSGEEFPAEVTLTPVVLADGPAVLAVVNDLTDRKHAEQQIRDHAVVLEFQKGQLEAANAALEEANSQLEKLAMTDGLTGLKNHRTFQERLSEEVSRAVRYGMVLTLILLDVDKFKQYNDTYGHPAGDAVLRTVAAILQEGARDTDVVARYGGEEFVLLLPQTDLQGALTFAERVRKAIENYSWPMRAVTASFGVASLRPTDRGGEEIVLRADEALYQSKAGGRNRVTNDAINSNGTMTPEIGTMLLKKTDMPTASPHISA